MSTMNPTSILIVLFVVLLVWTLILTFLYWKQQQFFRQMTKGVSKQDLKALLQNISASMKIFDADLSDLQVNVDNMKQADQTHLQKIGFIRFNPFSDTGGDQSFCICLLDEGNNGIIITSLHSREQTRIYAKNILAGKGDNVTFFEEEKKALKEAMAYKQTQPKQSSPKN